MFFETKKEAEQCARRLTPPVFVHTINDVRVLKSGATREEHGYFVSAPNDGWALDQWKKVCRMHIVPSERPVD